MQHGVYKIKRKDTNNLAKQSESGLGSGTDGIVK
jgi:hypothetical protein